MNHDWDYLADECRVCGISAMERWGLAQIGLGDVCAKTTQQGQPITHLCQGGDSKGWYHQRVGDEAECVYCRPPKLEEPPKYKHCQHQWQLYLGLLGLDPVEDCTKCGISRKVER